MFSEIGDVSGIFSISTACQVVGKLDLRESLIIISISTAYEVAEGLDFMRISQVSSIISIYIALEVARKLGFTRMSQA